MVGDIVLSIPAMVGDMFEAVNMSSTKVFDHPAPACSTFMSERLGGSSSLFAAHT